MLCTNQFIRPSIARGCSTTCNSFFYHRQLQAFSFAVAPSATFTLAPSDPTHNQNSPLSRSIQIARHISSSANSPTNSTIANMASQYKVRKVGAPNTLEHRIYIERDGVPVSPFHDIPLYANEERTILNSSYPLSAFFLFISLGRIADSNISGRRDPSLDQWQVGGTF